MRIARRRLTSVCASGLAATFVLTLEAQPSPVGAQPPGGAHRALVTRYCVACHNERLKSGGLALEAVTAQDVSQHPEVWEKVVRKLRARQMPPAGRSRPDEPTYDADRLARSRPRSTEPRPRNPNPGRTDTFRRLNRTEYQNADPRSAGAGHRRRGAAAGGRVQSRLRQRDGGRPLADAAGPLHHRGAEDQPAGGRQPGPLARRRHDPRSGRTSPRRSTSRGCRSARAAAR